MSSAVVPSDAKRQLRGRTIVAVVVLGVLILLALAVAYGVLRTTSVTVVNDGQRATRLSGCVEDSVDLGRGVRTSIDVASHGRTGCNVFVGGEYEGCLILDPRGRSTEPIGIQRGVHRDLSQSRCEALG